jgi:hypothetical protein
MKRFLGVSIFVWIAVAFFVLTLGPQLLGWIRSLFRP